MFSPLAKNMNICLVPLKIYNRPFEQRHLVSLLQCCMRLAERILLPLFWSLDKILLFTACTLHFGFLFFLVEKYVCIWNFMRFMTELKVYATESNQASRVCDSSGSFMKRNGSRVWKSMRCARTRTRTRTHAHRKRIRNNITQSIELFFTSDDGNYTLQPSNSLVIMHLAEINTYIELIWRMRIHSNSVRLFYCVCVHWFDQNNDSLLNTLAALLCLLANLVVSNVIVIGI